jgi:hypothetical protein
MPALVHLDALRDAIFDACDNGTKDVRDRLRLLVALDRRSRSVAGPNAWPTLLAEVLFGRTVVQLLDCVESNDRSSLALAVDRVLSIPRVTPAQTQITRQLVRDLPHILPETRAQLTHVRDTPATRSSRRRGWMGKEKRSNPRPTQPPAHEAG